MKFKEDTKKKYFIVPVSHIHLYPKVNFPADRKKTDINEHFKSFIFKYIVIKSNHY